MNASVVNASAVLTFIYQDKISEKIEKDPADKDKSEKEKLGKAEDPSEEKDITAESLQKHEDDTSTALGTTVPSTKGESD